jgi:hypothetical protein
MATDLDKWKTKSTLDVLKDAQDIVDKYREHIQEVDYIALCNANRVRYDRERRTQSPRSVNSHETQDRRYIPTVEDYQYRIRRLRERETGASRTLRHLPRAVKKITPSFKKRAVRVFADEMDLDDTVSTYADLKSMFPEIKYENDFYETAREIINKRLFLLRQDLKNEIRAHRSALKHLEYRLHTDFNEGTTFC